MHSNHWWSLSPHRRGVTKKMNEELEKIVNDIKGSVATEVKESLMPAITTEVFEQLKADLPNRKKELFGEDHRDEAAEVKEGKEKAAEFVRSVMTGDHSQAKALSTGTDADGGFLVPETFS